MRYFNVFGRRQDPDGAYAAVIPKFLKLLINGQVPTINGDGRQSRDFTYIENVIEANLKACLAPSEAAGQAYNIAYGGREYLIDIYYGLTKALGVNIEPNFSLTVREISSIVMQTSVKLKNCWGMIRNGASSVALLLQSSGIRRICDDEAILKPKSICHNVCV